MRERTACMTRIFNESRWIGRCLHSVWPVSETVVVFDDGSTDLTENCCIAATVGMELFPEVATELADRSLWVLDTNTVRGYQGERRILHYIHSPFTDAPISERTNEHRDKDFLWSWCKGNIKCQYMLCIDGDEALSRTAIQHFDTAITLLDEVDILEIPVLYLWDAENRIRVDGCYGNLSDGHPMARHPRLFTIKRLTEEQFVSTAFKSSPHGGHFHGGSIPQEGWGRTPTRSLFPYPIVHYGYIDRRLRERKHAFYTERDPKNLREGEYAHILEKQDHLCPGPPQFAQWEDV
jgi:hypothetical protein